MKIRSRFVCAIAILGAFTLATSALADSHGKADAADPAGKSEAGKQREPSPEDRAAMADAHQRMADCLRSSRPMNECRGEMKKAHASFGHGKRCEHGDSCPHDQSCPHGDACDGSCKHHGPHGHGAMGAKDKTTGKVAPKDEAATKKKVE